MPEPEEELESTQLRADRLIQAMRQLQPQGPYHLIGFCAGGLVAFEMAQQLSGKGQEVGFLGVVDCVDPQHPHSWRDRVRFNSQRAVWRTRQFLGRGPAGSARHLIGRLTQMGKTLKSEALHFKFRLFGKPGPPATEDLEEFLANKALRCAKRYYPTSYDGNCVVFVGSGTYDFQGLSTPDDPRMVWCKLSRGKSEVRKIPGDHLTMLSKPNAYEFAEQLKNSLNRE